MTEHAEKANQQYMPPMFKRLEILNDDLHIIRRAFEQPGELHPAWMDVMRLAIQYTHSRYESLACEMRREAEVL